MQVRSFAELRTLLKLAPPADTVAGASSASTALDANTILDGLVVLGHSTALSGFVVSSINPRVLLLGHETLLAFQRGVQQVELISAARDESALRFFLLNFRQACNDNANGCSPGDLFTPHIESNWTAVEVRDDEDLKNTPADCRQCHQRGRQVPMLLMRELRSPWTHFFELDPDDQAGSGQPGVRGRDLVRDYRQAKGDEPYGGIPAEAMRHTVALMLQNIVTEGQPLLFDAPAIERERWPYSPNGWPSEPERSATWDSAYQAFKRGEQLALPHFEPRPADVEKQAGLSAAYQQYLAGEIGADELPDLADIFPNDPQLRAEIGLQTEPGATPAQALVQACGACHNDVLDQSISRARFSIDLSRMDRAELDLAIERIELPQAAPGVMPPLGTRQLDPATQAQLLAYLRQDQRSSDDAALLGRAAMIGMTGGGEL